MTESFILVNALAISSIAKLGEKAGEQLAEGMERAYNYLSNFDASNLGNFCRGSYAALGASVGFASGAAVGSLGFAGGPTGAFTTYAGAGGGALVGTPLGIQAGNILCNSGGGGSGGGTGGGGSAPKEWTITNPSNTKVIGRRSYAKDAKTGLWWSKDTAGHAGSRWKVFKEGAGGKLEWFRDADAQGNFIDPNLKWKSEAGKLVK